MRASIAATLTFVAFVVYAPVVLAQAAPPCPFVWMQNLKVGSTGTDVLKLQQFLNASPDTIVSTTDAGSPGNETTRYGKLTAKAVAKFQEKYAASILAPAGLTSGTGAAGAFTRAQLNALCSVAATSAAPSESGANVAAAAGASATTSTQEADTLTVSDPGQPAAGIAPAGAGVNFISVTLTAGSKDVTVNNVTVERVGSASDQAFAAIALTDSSTYLQIGNQYPLNANHIVEFKTPFIIPAHTSQTFTIVGYMAANLTNYDGQMPLLQIRSITASSPVVGTFSLRGSPQTANNSLVVGGVTVALSPLDPNSVTTHYINEKGLVFSAIRMTANSPEDVSLSYMIWYQSGTAGSHDLANVVTVVGTTSYPAIPSADGKTYISIMNPAVIIPKGHSTDISIQGDLLPSGANRTVEFDLTDNTDDEGTGGNTYGFGVGVVPSGNTASSGNSVFLTSDGSTSGTSLTPFFSGSVTTISGGAIISVSR